MQGTSRLVSPTPHFEDSQPVSGVRSMREPATSRADGVGVGTIEAALDQIALDRRRIAFAPLSKVDDKSAQQQFWELRKQYNLALAGRQAGPSCEGALMEQLQKVYGGWFAHSSILLKDLNLQRLFENGQRPDASAFDDYILSYIDNADFFSHAERSYRISRLFCLLVKDSSQTEVLGKFGEYLSGEDFAYILCHSPPEMAELICTRFNHSIPIAALPEIQQAHSQLVENCFVRGGAFKASEEWLTLLKLCEKDFALAEKVYCGQINIPHCDIHFMAALCASYSRLREPFSDGLMKTLKSRCAYSVDEARWKKDEVTAWQLLLGDSCWVERSLEVMDKIQQQFPEEDYAEVLAQIISHPDRDKITGISKLITHENIKLILRHPYAACTLVYNPPSLFFEKIPDYVEGLSAGVLNLLLDHNPERARTILASCQGLDITNLADLADAYPDTVGVSACDLYGGLSESNQKDLLVWLRNPSVLEQLRSWQGYLYRERRAPYKEACERLRQCLPPATTVCQLDQKQAHELKFRYPCLVQLNFDYWGKNKSTLITDSDIFDGHIHPCRQAPELFHEMVHSEGVSDKGKLELARASSENMKLLIDDPIRFSFSPGMLSSSEEFHTVLKHPRHKLNVVSALEKGLLSNITSDNLFVLCQRHPQFAVMVGKHSLLDKLTAAHKETLTMENPAFAKLGLADELEACMDASGELDRDIQGECEQLKQYLRYRQRQAAHHKDIYSLPMVGMWDQDLLLRGYKFRVRGGGICRGLTLDFIRWRYRHPDEPPSHYLKKLTAYCAAMKHSTFHAKLTGTLPERATYLRNNSHQFLDDGDVISQPGCVTPSRVEMPGVQQGKLKELELLLKEEGNVFIWQGGHACGLDFWQDPADAKGLLSCFDANRGLISCGVKNPSQRWTEATHSWLKDALENNLLRHSSKVSMTVHRVDKARLSEVRVVPLRYRNADKAS